MTKPSGVSAKAEQEADGLAGQGLLSVGALGVCGRLVGVCVLVIRTRVVLPGNLSLSNSCSTLDDCGAQL
jgi:hypothetical protein